MEQNVFQRLKSVLSWSRLSVNSFAKKLNVAQFTTNNYFRGNREPRRDFLEKVTEAFPEISLSWLLTGEGEMLVTDAPHPPAAPTADNRIPLLPVAAHAGKLSEYSDAVTRRDCELMTSPLPGIDFALRVDGDSMLPELPGGSIVLVRKVDGSAFIEWGKVYVLDTVNGAVVKRIEPSDDDTLLCVSDNERYRPFKVNRSHIYGMYKVVCCVNIL